MPAPIVVHIGLALVGLVMSHVALSRSLDAFVGSLSINVKVRGRARPQEVRSR